LIIKGFKKQTLLSIEQIVEALTYIPKNHLRGITTLVYDPQRFYQRSYTTIKPINFKAVGEYETTPLNHILIYRFASHDEFRHILYHEVGHHVFKRYLDSVQRKRWVTQIYPNSTYVSSYAKTNAAEDFAESYASYIKKSPVLSAIPSKYKFIQNYF
jgi:AAA+ ATPase superfamily predicted ATPase